MTIALLRRRRLGKTSCDGIVNYSQNQITRVLRGDLNPTFDNIDMVIRWGCTDNVRPVQNVLNSARAIHLVNNKREFRKVLEQYELCPKTWFNVNDIPNNFRGSVVVRPSYHAQGRNVFVCTTMQGLRSVCQRLGAGNYYISELINKVAEYRVFVVQGRTACVAQKTPGNPNDIAWNVARGGRFDNVRWDNWPLKAVKYAIKAFNLSELHFGGVDVMVDANNNCYILEINSAPSLTSEYRQQCLAKCLDWIIINNSKDTIPLIRERDGYRKFIHPAIYDGAI